MPKTFANYRNDVVDTLEAWLQAHLNLIVFAVVAIGFLLRVHAANATYLNPDEALHYLLARQSSAIAAYKASLSNAHPPLFFLLLYFWRFLGRSEFILRLPSVLAGTAFLWFAFKWLETILGRTVGLIGLILLAFSPAMISLSAEVRSYALLLFFMAGALYFLERTFEEKSTGLMLLFSLFLYLAILTHYSAAWFTLALGVYSLLRIWGRELPGKVVRAWAGLQAGALALYIFLYVTHISQLKDSAMAKEVARSSFRPLYFHSGDDNLLLFVLERTFKVFRYAFGEPVLGGTMFALFLVSIALLLGRSAQPEQGKPISRYLGVLFLLPFVLGCGAAVAGLYPYGGTRHTAFLAPFAGAGVSFLLTKLAREKLWLGVLLAAAASAGGNLFGVPNNWQMDPQDQKRIWMSQALDHIRQTVPPGGLIFVDFQSNLLLNHYLCGTEEVHVDTSVPGLPKSDCAGYRIVQADLWAFTAANFRKRFEQMARTYDLKPGEDVWMFQAGWDSVLDIDMPRHYPQFRCLAPKHFGKNISVFRVVVGPTSLPMPPALVCQTVWDPMTNPAL